ncbi:hypothetical protein CRG98_048222, partial [Punica granatum]
MYGGKSWGSGRDSVGSYGSRDPRRGCRGSFGKTSRHAYSGHGTVQDPSVPRPEQTRKCETKFGENERNPVREKRMNDGCARLVGPRTVTTSSRGRGRVVRNPLNMMARLAEVVRGNGTRGGLRYARLGVSGPDCVYGWNG